MIKLSICEPCVYTENKIVAAKYTSGYKGGDKVGLCLKHQDYFKGATSITEFTERNNKMFLAQKAFGADFVLA